MPDSDLLVVEFSRDGEDPVKELVVDEKVYGPPEAEGGMRALLAAVAMMFQRKGLRAGDRLTVRLPIEGLDIPGG